MSEWIEKEEVLKQIDCWFTTGEYKYSNATHYLNKRISSIKPKESEWISVKDKLPDEEQKVLCFTCDEEIVVADFSHFSYDFGELGEWHYWGIRPPEFVTHWMPLPEPPESEDDVE